MECARCGERIESADVECPYCRHSEGSKPFVPWWKSTEAVLVIGVLVVLLIVGGVMWKRKADSDARKAKEHCESVNAWTKALGGRSTKC